MTAFLTDDNQADSTTCFMTPPVPIKPLTQVKQHSATAVLTDHKQARTQFAS